MKRSLLLIGMSSLILISCTPRSLSLQETHVHGMAVDRGDSNRLYLATHNGLYVLTNDQELAQVSERRDDFMGFSPHPTDPNIVFSSGHPKGGGNLGLMRSDNAGKTWRKAANGNPQGPADFHAMTVHAANPDHLYGWYKLRIHRSLDGGRTWEVLPAAPPEVFSFAGDPGDDRTVYIGTVAGLWESRDRGEAWESISEELRGDVVFDVAVEAAGSLVLSTKDHGIVRFTKGKQEGPSLESLGSLPRGDVAEYLAIDPKNPQTLYAFGEAHVLYKSTNGGKVWQKVL